MREPRVVQQSLTSLPSLLEALGSRRVLVLCGPSRRWVSEVESALSGYPCVVFDGARRHVPEEVVEAAAQAAERHRADTLVSVGGGSATGLGKALKLRTPLRFVCIPTTYAGSEYTNLYGITSGGGKMTGRDDVVLPDVILHDERLTSSMPLQLTVTSLFNALSHPLGVLEGGDLAPDLERDALHAASQVYGAVEVLVRHPDQTAARARAASGAGLAASVLARGTPGLHHRLAHVLGGRFDIEHSTLHAALLPHTVRQLRLNRPSAFDRVREAIGVHDLEAALFDILTRAGAPTSLRALELSDAQLTQLLASEQQLPRELLWDAFHGRWPSRAVRREDWGLRHTVACWGPPPDEARRVIVALHGRGSNADAMVRRCLELSGNDPGLAIIAPQAPNCSWYGPRHVEPRQVLGAELETSLNEGLQLLHALAERAPDAPVVLVGFSQGACLALEVFARSERALAALVALSGSGIGGTAEPVPFDVRVAGTPVLMGASVGDPWLSADEVAYTARQLSELGCRVQLEMVPGDVHTFHDRHRWLARPLLRGRPTPETHPGLRVVVETESLPGALPRVQNSPRRVPYGLYAEQLNATGFVAERGHNLRSWLYRVRPSAQHTSFERLEHPTLRADWEPEPEINLAGLRPLPFPEAATDFVDGLVTVGGAGSPLLRRGYAVHVYAANRNMHDRCFCNADGELLILPQHGALTLLSECGVLDVEPGWLALVPRGLRFSVLLKDSLARGYVAEVYGRAFELPDRGPIGANGLTESRHFRAPSAWHEDRLAVGYHVVHKLGGALFQARQDYSPYDVVAWHGNLSPVVYDLASFSPVGNTRFDHGDPSGLTVLSAPLDERGSNCLDLVAFVPRWDPSEATFRPPYFHRNATTEINGVLRSSGSSSDFEPGCLFLTPSLTPHGVRSSAVEGALSLSDAVADVPARGPDDSLWFQLESALPFCFTPWAKQAPCRRQDWPTIWGTYRHHFEG